MVPQLPKNEKIMKKIKDYKKQSRTKGDTIIDLVKIPNLYDASGELLMPCSSDPNVFFDSSEWRNNIGFRRHCTTQTELDEDFWGQESVAAKKRLLTPPLSNFPS
jgi:hypothetical protein